MVNLYEKKIGRQSRDEDTMKNTSIKLFNNEMRIKVIIIAYLMPNNDFKTKTQHT